MSEHQFKLPNAPIVEAVLDIECDMPAGLQLQSLESQARDYFRDQYPKFRPKLIQHHRIESKQGEASKHSVESGVQALQFLTDDEKQLVQVRDTGYSFNRLAPYSSLDDYLPEIERTWKLFIELVSPAQIRLVRLRYINRILLPTENGKVSLDDYLKVGPHLPDEEKLTFVGFLNQHAAVEKDTGHQVNMVLTAQPLQGDKQPIIFDNCVAAVEVSEPQNWAWISGKIQVLRELKNRIFRNTLTEKCLNLFQ